MMNNKGVVGTGENSSGNLTQSVFIYNPASNTWQAVANFQEEIEFMHPHLVLEQGDL
jgi:hypothetical protein